MNIITQAHLWTPVPVKGGYVQIVRRTDGYHLQLDRTSGILSIFKQGETGVIEISPSGWISLTSEPSQAPALEELVRTAEEPTKVWTKPKKK
jgi:hypothetical protein